MRATPVLFALTLFLVPLASVAGEPVPDTMSTKSPVVADSGPVPVMAPAPVADPVVAPVVVPTETKTAAKTAAKTGTVVKTAAKTVVKTVAKTTAKTAKKPQPIGPPTKQPETVIEAVKTIGLMIQAAQEGWWGIFAGLLIMLLLFVAEKVVGIKKRIGAKAVPWVAAGLGILASMASQLSTGIPWGQALLQGFTAGVVAVGLWELLFKHAWKKEAAPAALVESPVSVAIEPETKTEPPAVEEPEVAQTEEPEVAPAEEPEAVPAEESEVAEATEVEEPKTDPVD